MQNSPMRVSLISHTPDPVALAAFAARTCYAGGSMDRLKKRVETEDQTAFLSGVIGSGHASVMEHASFTFAIEGVSRSFLAQITRHRIASFSVQSQRYVDMAKGFAFITPPAIQDLGEEAVREYEGQMAQMHAWYTAWQARLGGKGEKANEDARFVLPNACQTQMIVTMNARELHHFFAVRCCERAQWEIRAAARRMYALCYEAAPGLFQNAGPGCLHGACPEGKRTCGRVEYVRNEMETLQSKTPMA